MVMESALVECSSGVQTPLREGGRGARVRGHHPRLPREHRAWRRALQHDRLRWQGAQQPDEYIKRSPLYRVDSLRVPILVHVATNDTDVNFVESQQLIDALRARKPALAETKIYVDPPPGRAGGGHTFSRRVNRETLEREDTPEQRDSWNRTWTFLEWWLRPNESAADSSGRRASAATSRR